MSYRIVRGDYFQIYVLWPGREILMWLVPIGFAILALGCVVIDELLQVRRHESARPEHIPYDRQAPTGGGEHLR